MGFVMILTNIWDLYIFVCLFECQSQKFWLVFIFHIREQKNGGLNIFDKIVKGFLWKETGDMIYHDVIVSIAKSLWKEKFI